VITSDQVDTDTSPPILETAVLSETGSARARNAGSVALFQGPQQGQGSRGKLLIVADGLGGNTGGEATSALVTRELAGIYYAKSGKNHFQNLKEAVAETNRRVYEAGNASEAQRGMCASVVAGLVVNRFLMLAHVGDSRGYLFRDGRLMHKTLDQALRGDLFDKNGEYPRQNGSHVLTQALGSRPTVRPAFAICRVHDGDTILLCTDGLTEAVSDDEVRECLTDSPAQQIADEIMSLAKSHDGENAISLLFSRIVDVGPKQNMPISINDLDYYFAGDL